MHSAPSVSFPVGRSRDAGLLLGLGWAAGAICVAVTVRRYDGPGWQSIGLLASVVAAGAMAALAHWRQRPGTLSFDGQVWHLTGATTVDAARLVPALDLQRLLLVRLVGTGRRPRWLWLERRSAPQRWRALRRAVYSRAPSADPADPIAAPSRSTGSPPPSA